MNCINCGADHVSDPEPHLATEIGSNDDGEAVVRFFIFQGSEITSPQAEYKAGDVRHLFVNVVMQAFLSESFAAMQLAMRSFKYPEDEIDKVLSEASVISQARRREGP
jgi:hypothetical protein